MKTFRNCGIVIATAASLFLTACTGGQSKAVPPSSVSKDVRVYVPAPPASARKSPEAFKAAAAKTIAAENVRGRFHVARDGVSRVYEQHVDFVLPGWKMSGHVTGVVVGPNDRITILADFAHGDTLVRHHEAGTRATSSLEIDS